MATDLLECPESFLGLHISELPTPAFLVNLSHVKHNCSNMLKKCNKFGIKLRPHVKTHKTIEGSLLQTGGKKSGIIVSTINELAFFIQNGFDDIILARPATADVLKRCTNLRRDKTIYFFVNSEETAEAVQSEAGEEIVVLLKIDAGYHRAGIPWDEKDRLISLGKKLLNCPNVVLRGIYAHCGDTYTSEGPQAIKKIRDDTIFRVLSVKETLEKHLGIVLKEVSIGSTPSCSLDFSQNMTRLTEVHAGNYIFYDAQQASYGSCNKENDIAVRVMTRVVAHQPKARAILVDLGFTGLTKQGLDLACPGFASILNHSDLKLSALTQELGKIERIDGKDIDFNAYGIGSILHVIPYHACATAGLYPFYYVHDDSDKVCQIWKPTRGW